MATNCTTKSLTPTWVTLGFIGCSLMMLLVTSFYSIKSLKGTINKPVSVKHGSSDKATEEEAHENEAFSPKNNSENPTQEKDDTLKAEDTTSNDITVTISTESKEKEILKEEEDTRTWTTIQPQQSKWDEAKCFGKFKMWFKDVWTRKGVYLPLFAHLSDTATDFAAVVEFGQIASTYDASECGTNVWYLFTLSIIAMVVYRIISSFTVYRITKSVKRTILQFIDIELFEILWLSHRLGLKHKSSPQRLISILEAIFEAAPQTMIQLVYLLSTGTLSGVIVFSTVLSFINLTMTVIADDKTFSKIKRTDERDDIATMQCGEMRCTGSWIMLRLFRICDIPSHILMYVFLWYVINGYVLIAVFAVDVLVAIYLYKKTNDVEALMSIIAIPFVLGGKDFRLSDALLTNFLRYSFVRCIVVIVTIWIGIAVNGWVSSGGFLWIFCFIASMTKYYWRRCLSFGTVEKKERVNVQALLRSGLYDDAISLICYINMDFDANVKKLHSGCPVTIAKDDDDRKWFNDQIYSFLAIAAACKESTELFGYILNIYGLDIDLDDNNEQYKTALMVATEIRNQQYIESIMDIAEWDYIQKTDIYGTALRNAIRYTYDGDDDPHYLEDDDLVQNYLNCVDDKIQTDKDYNDKKIDLLNKCGACGRTALHIAAERAPLSVFKSVYNFYPDYYKNEALQKKDEDGKTPLDCSENRKITEFIETAAKK